ncbi:hypothetical protein PPL_09562 [Heterostelium album PN500]|uniref:CSC1/OSCA1-like 7TM region domain-containing protein n=1 Tax=Heterostelium pallidum (strain ATCC 26659 / Pp 5 / PN500) TaxID=670386 RepID=D3BNF0_HETP5|nr:hypothetical protein PPL_09562 [Heterostelium album PN500]EFA76810.1 hypothetical protein PPL_09562 [Heterostelium album PN500]|eukprot:XP_020428942.1 hypothetical protein PPL_09562 [Heterostelium album PN500]
MFRFYKFLAVLLIVVEIVTSLTVPTEYTNQVTVEYYPNKNCNGPPHLVEYYDTCSLKGVVLVYDDHFILYNTTFNREPIDCDLVDHSDLNTTVYGIYYLDTCMNHNSGVSKMSKRSNFKTNPVDPAKINTCTAMFYSDQLCRKNFFIYQATMNQCFRSDMETSYVMMYCTDTEFTFYSCDEKCERCKKNDNVKINKDGKCKAESGGSSSSFFLLLGLEMDIFFSLSHTDEQLELIYRTTKEGTKMFNLYKLFALLLLVLEIVTSLTVPTDYTNQVTVEYYPNKNCNGSPHLVEYYDTCSLKGVVSVYDDHFILYNTTSHRRQRIDCDLVDHSDLNTTIYGIYYFDTCMNHNSGVSKMARRSNFKLNPVDPAKINTCTAMFYADQSCRKNFFIYQATMNQCFRSDLETGYVMMYCTDTEFTAYVCDEKCESCKKKDSGEINKDGKCKATDGGTARFLSGSHLWLYNILIVMAVTDFLSPQNDSSSSNSTVSLTTGWKGFSSNFFTNIIIATILFTLFYFLRFFYRSFYNARLIKSNGATSHLITSPIAWLRYTWSFPVESVFESRGIDAYMHLRFLILCIQLLSIILVFGIGVLLPLNFTSSNSYLHEQGVTINNLDSVSIASIPEGSKRLWAHSLSIPLFTGVSLFLFRRTYLIYVEKRIRWMSKHHPRNYSVMVREMSKSIKNESDMRNYFQNFFDPKEILACHIVYKEPKLRDLWSQYRSTKRKLDRIISKTEITHLRPTRAKGWRPGTLGGEVEDSLSYYEKKLVMIDEKLKEAQIEASLPKEGVAAMEWKLSDLTPSNIRHWTSNTANAGFITFDRMANASICSTCIFSEKPNKFIVTPAPEFKNIKWGNLVISGNERMFRRIVISIAFFVLFCFYMIPVTAISAISKLENLAKVPILNWMVKVVELNPYLQGLVEGYLPSLALVAFMGLLPLFIKLLVHVNKENTKTMFYHKVFTTYWAFLVVNVFIVVTISGSVLSVLFRVIENLTLKQIITLFGSSLPTQSSFFINYILVQSLTSVPFDIIRPIELIAGIIRSTRVTSPGDKVDAMSRNDPTALTSIKYARELLILVITLSYSTLSPFILPFGLMYFLIDFYVSKYNHIYSFCPKYQSGGTIWPLVFNRLCVGLIIYQLTAVGIFLLKAFIPGIIISFPLPFITLFVWWITVQDYKKASSVLPLHLSPEGDFFGNEFLTSYQDPVVSVSDMKF